MSLKFTDSEREYLIASAMYLPRLREHLMKERLMSEDEANQFLNTFFVLREDAVKEHEEILLERENTSSNEQQGE